MSIRKVKNANKISPIDYKFYVLQGTEKFSFIRAAVFLTIFFKRPKVWKKKVYWCVPSRSQNLCLLNTWGTLHQKKKSNNLVFIRRITWELFRLEKKPNVKKEVVLWREKNVNYSQLQNKLKTIENR